MTDPCPLITVIIPMRNEARYIERCLDALAAQDYPAERFEVLVIDGMSTDTSPGLVERFLHAYPNFQIIKNPQRITPVAFNTGIRRARGEIIAIVSAHAVLAPDYLSRCVAALQETRADNVGGPMRAVSETYVGQAIAAATSSPFGVGGARFHYAETAQWVDTVYMGAYPRTVFERIGLFDEELVRNQDDEFNFRLTRAGGKIWLDPQIQSVYFSRGTLRGLWKQYYEYGFWKVRVIQKHGRPASVRHLVPALFVLALTGSLLLALATLSPLWFLLIAVPYVLAAVAASVMAARGNWRALPLLPVIFFVLHFAYGLGFLVGLVHWNRPGVARTAAQV